MMQVVVLIPAYNEALTIADVAQRVLALPQPAWLIVVDDGSDDGTAEQLSGLASAANKLILLRHDDNRGKAASLWTGIDEALARGADAVITLDGDGQHRPEDVTLLIEQARRYANDIIIAARLRGRATVPKARRFANAQADFWISWAAGYPIRDTQSGFRLYPRALLQRMAAGRERRSLRASGFVFESEVLIDAARSGCYARTVSIAADYPQQARTSHYRPGLDTLLIIRMVAWKLITRGLNLKGLLRAQGLLPDPRQKN